MYTGKWANLFARFISYFFISKKNQLFNKMAKKLEPSHRITENIKHVVLFQEKFVKLIFYNYKSLFNINFLANFFQNVFMISIPLQKKNKFWKSDSRPIVAKDFM